MEINIERDEGNLEELEEPNHEGRTSPPPTTAEAYENEDYIPMPHEWPFVIKAYQRYANLSINPPPTGKSAEETDHSEEERDWQRFIDIPPSSTGSIASDPYEDWG